MRRLFLAVTGRPEIRYLVVGGLNTAFSYALYAIALLILHAASVPGDFAIATAFSWLVSNLTSFVLQRRFVFRGTGSPVREFVKFTSVTFGSFLANLALGWFAVSVLGLTSAVEKLVSQLVITFVLVVITYVLHKYFSFRGAVADPAGMGAVEHDPEHDPEDDRTPPR